MKTGTAAVNDDNHMTCQNGPVPATWLHAFKLARDRGQASFVYSVQIDLQQSHTPATFEYVPGPDPDR